MSGTRFFWLFLLTLLGAGCERRDVEDGEKKSDAQPVAFKVCGLLPAPEIAQILGGEPVRLRDTTQNDGRFYFARCLIEMSAAKDSVHIEVVQRAGGVKGQDPREDWKRIFHTTPEPKLDRLGRPKQPPKRDVVSGVGDEAFWTGQPLGATLHVISGPYVIRINGGGPNDPLEQQRKFRRIAEILLQRLK